MKKAKAGTESIKENRKREHSTTGNTFISNQKLPWRGLHLAGKIP